MATVVSRLQAACSEAFGLVCAAGIRAHTCAVYGLSAQRCLEFKPRAPLAADKARAAVRSEREPPLLVPPAAEWLELGGEPGRPLPLEGVQRLHRLRRKGPHPGTGWPVGRAAAGKAVAPNPRGLSARLPRPERCTRMQKQPSRLGTRMRTRMESSISQATTTTMAMALSTSRMTMVTTLSAAKSQAPPCPLSAVVERRSRPRPCHPRRPVVTDGAPPSGPAEPLLPVSEANAIVRPCRA